MNIKTIGKAIENYSDKEPNLFLNEATITWQVSHVWIAGGYKENYESIEEFYLNTIFKLSPYESGYVGQGPWIERVNLTKWCNGLKLEKVNDVIVQAEVEQALAEALENKDNWDGEFSPEKFKIPSVLLEAYSVSESVDARTALGGHWGFIFSSDNAYFYLERNWES